MNIMKEKIHTWCSCWACRYWKSWNHNRVRKVYHKRNRKRHKQELKNKWEIINPNYSIWYTD